MNRFTGKSIIVGIGAVALAVASFSVVSAQQGPPPPPGPGMQRGPGGPGGPGMRRGAGGPGMMLRQLDLTEAQRAQVKSIMDAHKTEVEGIGTKMREARKGLQAAMETIPVNEEAIREATAALAAVQAEANVHRANVRAEVFSILTDEQKAKAAQLKASAEARRAAMRDRVRNRVKARQAQPPKGEF